MFLQYLTTFIPFNSYNAGKVSCFCCLGIFNVFKKIFQEVSKSVEPDLGAKCLQKLSVDDANRQRVNMTRMCKSLLRNALSGIISQDIFSISKSFK